MVFSKKQFNVLCDVSLRLNDLRNCAVETTVCVKSSDGKHFLKVNYNSVISKVKKEFKDKFSGIQDHIAGATIKKHVDSFNGYIALMNKFDEEYDMPVNEPKKRDVDCLSNIIIPRESITCSNKKLDVGYIELSFSREYKKQLESKDCRPKINIPENIRDKKLMQVEIIPIKNGKMFKLTLLIRRKKILGI